MNQTPKKILLAIDGSVQSLDAVRYASTILIPQRNEVVLFHVMRKIDQAFWDMGVNPAFHKKIAGIAAWEEEQKRAAKEFMDHGRQILINEGFPTEAVKINIHEGKVGIARDIINESKHDYNAVVVGRRGLSKLKDLVLGSVAHKLLEKLVHTSICVVGGSPRSEKMLLAFDTSEGAMKAVDYVGTMFGGSNFEVTLLHVIRGFHIFPRKESMVPLEKEEWPKEAKMEIESALNKAGNHLTNAGFERNRVKTKLITGVASRAGAIVEEAKRGDYGTIVVGRRGLSRVEDFFMGRVSNKVIQLAKETAVWVVS